MTNLELPLRPSNDDEYSALSKIDKDIIVEAVITQVPNSTAFLRFHPEYAHAVSSPNGRGHLKYKLNSAGDVESKHFWSYPKHRQFREDYEKTLTEFFGRKQTTRRIKNDEPSHKRRDEALNKLMSDCLDAIDSNSSLDPEILKDFVTMAKALGVLKEEQEKIEPVRRYLPARCYSECSYRFFVENHIKSGDIISECDYCRTRKFAEENGWKFDPTTNLDIPTENNNIQ